MTGSLIGKWFVETSYSGEMYYDICKAFPCLVKESIGNEMYFVEHFNYSGERMFARIVTIDEMRKRRFFSNIQDAIKETEHYMRNEQATE